MSAAIKPEVYISWVPTGVIGLKPQIYATYIPTPDKARADLLRKISASESTRADSLRRIGTTKNFSADTLREVINSDKTVADTKRKIFVKETFSGNTSRRIVQIDETHADTFREIKKTERTIVDTSRKIGLITIRADILRQINATTISIADTFRQTGIKENISTDLLRRTTRNETTRADTFRKVNKTVMTLADTNRKIGVMEKLSVKTKRVIGNFEVEAADTFLQITATEKVTADLLRGIREFVRVATFRKITRIEKAIASTVIRIPHVLNYFLKKNLLKFNSRKTRLLSDSDSSSTTVIISDPIIINTLKNYNATSVNLTLREKTLSDTLTLNVANDAIEINDAVQGQLLDYCFTFLAEETQQTGAIQSVKCMYNIDELLYSQFRVQSVIEAVDGGFIDTNKDIDKKASQYMSEFAETLAENYYPYVDFKSVILIDDFTPYNLNGTHYITYADLLTSLFGWTSRVPQRQINVFLRSNALYVIQRGKEKKVFNLNAYRHSAPVINKKLVRSLWSQPKNNITETGTGTDDDPLLNYLYDENQELFSGTISFSDEGCSTKLTYEKGLLVQEINKTENAKATLSSAVSYSYEEIFPAGTTELSVFINNFVGDFYISRKIMHSEATTRENDNDGETAYKTIEQNGTVKYRYGKTDGDDVYLSSEIENTTTKTYENNNLTDTDTDVRETFHVPIGNGWYGQSVYHNGAAQGSNISQGKPGNKVTQYTINEAQKTFKGWKITYNKGDNTGTQSEMHSGTGTETQSGNEEKLYEDRRRKLAPIVDISFPVRELDLLSELTSDLDWLNRAIQETVTVDLIAKVQNGTVIDADHIVDFSERVKLDDAEYFLVSNNISFTPREFIQKLTLIRWCSIDGSYIPAGDDEDGDPAGGDEDGDQGTGDGD